MDTSEHNVRGYPCDGLASHPGGSRNTPSRFMLQMPEIIAEIVATWVVSRSYLPFLNSFIRLAKVHRIFASIQANISQSSQDPRC